MVVSKVAETIHPGGDNTVELTEIAALIRKKLDPKPVLAARIRSLIRAPESAWTDDVPASMWADPSFPDPMYELLTAISPEFLMPGIGDLAKNSVALAIVNTAFVEAFLLGANLELSREFVWREYPADPRETWLRTFWDYAGETASDGAALEDIERIAEWGSGSLGTHQAATDPARMLVLVIKGDLLRRYPDTLIYAVPAQWDGKQRVESESESAEYPIFVGSLGTDAAFLGFQFGEDVKVPSDVVGSPKSSNKKPGWFFVFEQPPTTTRFGLDVGSSAQAGKKPSYWKDVSWYHALGAKDSTATHAPISVLDDNTSRKYDNAGDNTWEERWGRHAGAMARITLQRPVRILIHADRML